MMKTLLIILLTAIAAASGNYFAAALKKRAEYLKLAGYMAGEIKNLIEYRSSDVYEIISHLAADRRFDDFLFIKAAEKLCEDRTVPFGEAWEKSLSENIPVNFHPSDTEVLCSLGKNLGKSGHEGQISELALRQKELEMLYEEAERLYSSKAKLYRSLGVLSGAFFAVLLI